MSLHAEVQQPLPQKTRHRVFLSLVFVFVIAIPFLYMYATGYRFDIQKPTTLVSTGGMYIGVDRLGAEIFIDNALMRETRTFRKAFYAQGLEAGSHRVHVQKEGYHTWVKELPVTKHRVTVAEAFNLPLIPQVRVIAPYETTTGIAVIPQPMRFASSTNTVIATTTLAVKSLTRNDEFYLLRANFASTSTSTGNVPPAQNLKEIVRNTIDVLGTTTPQGLATTTVVSNGVALYRSGEDVFARWTDSFTQMPYYFCAEDFRIEDTGTISTTTSPIDEEDLIIQNTLVLHPVQTVARDVACDPTIRIDREGSRVYDFDFVPGSADLVVLIEEDGAYVIEIDNRAWQNKQPLFLGDNLEMHIEGGTIYFYDGALIYELVSNLEQ